jgi:hypothetical protein
MIAAPLIFFCFLGASSSLPPRLKEAFPHGMMSMPGLGSFY